MSGENGAVVVVEGAVEHENPMTEKLVAEFGREHSRRFAHDSSVNPNSVAHQLFCCGQRVCSQLRCAQGDNGEMTALEFSESIVVAASVDDVYAVVSDVTRTGEWSPICQECWWNEPDGGGVGSTFTGRNVVPGRTWRTCRRLLQPNPAVNSRGWWATTSSAGATPWSRWTVAHA
ncbi:SRPBCC family protein [Rhodococcus sp. BS-15]|uniref:SRPBCC family protein n=1 Tax=Rhodococcus sp. BS-15 TaxID=1304954 RepID=UPI0035B50B79